MSEHRCRYPDCGVPIPEEAPDLLICARHPVRICYLDCAERLSRYVNGKHCARRGCLRGRVSA